jgi:hypothetical protein
VRNFNFCVHHLVVLYREFLGCENERIVMLVRYLNECACYFRHVTCRRMCSPLQSGTSV